MTDVWLTAVYRLVKKGESNDGAIDIVYDRIDDLHREGEFDQVDEILQRVDLDQLNSTLMVAFLCITKLASERGHLPYRPTFVKRIVARMESMGIEPERIEERLRLLG